MHRIYRYTVAVAAALFVFPVTDAHAQDDDRTVTEGGIFVDGWQGTTHSDQGVENARLAEEGGALRVTTGPAITYWNTANTASGDYTVSATFTESEYMALNNHPHPYGIVIGGNGMGTDQQSYLYCAAYGNGRFIVRGFGPEPFQVNGRRPEEHAAVNQAAGPGEPVTQEIAVSVRGDQIECAINGTVVGSYDKASVVTAGKLMSTDGVYGIRFAHNTEASVTGLSLTQH